MKRLVVDVPKEVHRAVQETATRKYMSMAGWLRMIIDRALASEESHKEGQAA